MIILKYAIKTVTTIIVTALHTYQSDLIWGEANIYFTLAYYYLYPVVKNKEFAHSKQKN